MMHAIISHDVDHLHSREHLRDPVLVKSVARAWVEMALGRISPLEMLRRDAAIVRGRLENLQELLAFDNAHGIRPTFFFAVAKGLGLSYENPAMQSCLQRLTGRDCDLGIHGMAYNDPAEMRREQALFATISGLDRFGIRMHYLRKDASTLPILGQLGYTFDTTGSEDRGPWRHVSGLWVFPLHLMDGWFLMDGTRWQNRSSRRAFAVSKERIDRLADAGVDYLTINFHDSYFCSSYASWRDWYIQVVQHLEARGIQFSTYREAIIQLESAQSDPSRNHLSNALARGS